MGQTTQGFYYGDPNSFNLNAFGAGFANPGNNYLSSSIINSQIAQRQIDQAKELQQQQLQRNQWDS